MRRSNLDDSVPGRRQNWWVAAIVLLLAALACVSAGFWLGAGLVTAAAVLALLVSFLIRP